MSIAVVRYEQANGAHWGVQFGDRIAAARGDYPTTGDLVREGTDELRKLTVSNALLSVGEVRLLSPITTNQQFICQGINYESHIRESGMDPAKIGFNTLFTKASSCLCGANDDVFRPAHVRLLDYEVELGLVLGRDISGPVSVRPDALHEFVAGVTIVNDISARDVQLPQGQFYKGKSYRTFGPAGPVLLLLSEAEWRRWPELRMQLTVNGEPRQDALCAEMIHPPHATLTELSGMQDLATGDLIATGTPAGCAVRAPGKLPMFIMRHFMSEATKWRLFIKKGASNPRYLQPGDEILTTIRTDDGGLDLGAQRSRVVQG